MNERRQTFAIVDRRTGESVTSVTYLNRDTAEQNIAAWQDRHDRGGRPDVTRETLLNMRVVEGSGDR